MKRFLLILFGILLVFLSFVLFSYGVFFSWLTAAPPEETPEILEKYSQIVFYFLLASLISMIVGLIVIITNARSKPAIAKEGDTQNSQDIF